MAVREYMPTLYGSDEIDFTSNGYGFLADGISCEVTEEIGNSFELEMDYPVTGVYYDMLAIGNIITCRTNTNNTKKQPFRIYRITKPIDGIVTLYAQHISYDLAGYTVDRTNTDYAKDNSATVSTIVNFIGSCVQRYANEIGGIQFTFEVEGQFDTAAWSITSFTDVRSMMKTAATQFGGEWEYDGTNCILHAQRGQDRGVTVDYGKNLSDITEDSDISNTYTHVMPYYKGRDSESGEDVIVGGLSAAVGTGAEIGYNRTIGVDFSGEFAAQPTVEQLQAKASKYIGVTQVGKIVVSRDVTAVDRGQTAEYPGLKGSDIIEIGDTIGINVPVLGISASMRCMRIVYDAYLDLVKTYEIGDVKKSYIAQAREDLDEVEDKIDDLDDYIDDLDDWRDEIEDEIADIEEELHERMPTLFIQEDEPEGTEDDPLVNGDEWLQIDKDKNAIAYYQYSSSWTVQCFFKGDFDPIIQAAQPEETTSSIKQYDFWFTLSVSKEDLPNILDLSDVNINQIDKVFMFGESWNKCIYGHSTGSPVATINTEVGDLWFTHQPDGMITTLWICTQMDKSGQSFTAHWKEVYPTDEAGLNSNFYFNVRVPVQVGDYWLKIQTDQNRIAQGLAQWSGTQWDLVLDFENGGGVGQFMDPGHTSERFNDYSPVTYDATTQKYTGGNWSDCIYTHLEGSENHVVITDRTHLYDQYWGAAIHIEGWDNQVTQTVPTVVPGSGQSAYVNEMVCIAGRHTEIIDSGHVYVYGSRNHLTESAYCYVWGDWNEITESFRVAVLGRRNQISNINRVDRFGQFEVLIGDYGRLDGSQIFAVGNGHNNQPENAFEVKTNGVYAATYNTLGADYAEYFEWADGNPDNEDRCGMLVMLTGDKIEPAHGDEIFGVVSAAPSVVGNAFEMYWHGKYVTDVYGRVMKDEAGKPIISNNYDKHRKYIPRSERQEWAAIGMTGRLVINDDGSCKVGGYVSARHGKGTSCFKNTGVRVLRRVDENHVEIIIK